MPMGELAEGEDKSSKHEQFLVADLHAMDELLKLEKSDDFKPDIVWRNVVLFAVLHICGLISIYNNIFFTKWTTIIQSNTDIRNLLIGSYITPICSELQCIKVRDCVHKIDNQGFAHFVSI